MSPITVLVVNDDGGPRRQLINPLAGRGLDCEEATGVEDAIRLLATHTYDAVVCDLVMPGPGPCAGSLGPWGYVVTCYARGCHPSARVMQVTSYPAEYVHADVFSVNADWTQAEGPVVRVLADPDAQPAAPTGARPGGCLWNALIANPPAGIARNGLPILHELAGTCHALAQALNRGATEPVPLKDVRNLVFPGG